MTTPIGPVILDLLEERGASVRQLRRLRDLVKANGCVECASPEPSSHPNAHFHADVDRAMTYRFALDEVPIGPGFTTDPNANARHALLTLLELVLEGK